MAAKKPKRIEVLSTKVKQLVDSPESEMTFEDILIFMNGRKCYDEFKEYELKLIDIKLNNCIVGIIITGQNKNLPAKRDRATGEFHPLNLDPDKETLSFGNIFLYDKSLNILLYEVNINGCYIDKFVSCIYQEWQKDGDDDIKFDLSFPVLSRKGEYERLLNMTYYKEFFVELTCPQEILEEYKDDNSSILSIVKRHLKDGIQNNTDSIIIRYSTFGKKENKEGLARRPLLKVVDSVRYLFNGNQKKNVKALKIKGYLQDPDEKCTMKPVNLVTDTFNIFIKLTVKLLLTDIQQSERQQEIEKLYIKHLPEFKYIIK